MIPDVTWFQAMRFPPPPTRILSELTVTSFDPVGVQVSGTDLRGVHVAEHRVADERSDTHTVPFHRHRDRTRPPDPIDDMTLPHCRPPTRRTGSGGVLVDCVIRALTVH